MTENLIVFAHGKESGPWGIKIKHLAKTAEQRGFDVISPDYRHTQEPQARIDQLITLRPQARRLVLAGSRSEEHTSELQSLMRISYAVFCLKKKKKTTMNNVSQLKTQADNKSHTYMVP